MAQPLWKALWHHLRKLNTYIFYDTAILVLCIYPTEMHTHVYQEASTRIFIITLFVRGKN